jgi:hypothetical protein
MNLLIIYILGSLAFFISGALLNQKENQKLVTANQAMLISVLWPLFCMAVLAMTVYKSLVGLFDKISGN